MRRLIVGETTCNGDLCAKALDSMRFGDEVLNAQGKLVCVDVADRMPKREALWSDVEQQPPRCRPLVLLRPVGMTAYHGSVCPLRFSEAVIVDLAM